MGWAALQIPWSTVDTALHPAARAVGLETEMLRWGMARAHHLAAERGQAFTLYQSVPAERADTISWLMENGFEPAHWRTVHLTLSLTERLPLPQLPSGFKLRPLRGEVEVGDYVALHRAAFGTDNMTVEWRARTLQTPHYVPKLDVVAVAPEGRLAAFCVGWALPNHAETQVEPLGVHPDFQHLGLGRAVLLEGLRRMQALGAALAHVETYSINDPACGLYESAGFQVAHTPVTYARTFVPDSQKDSP